MFDVFLHVVLIFGFLLPLEAKEVNHLRLGLC